MFPTLSISLGSVLALLPRMDGALTKLGATCSKPEIGIGRSLRSMVGLDEAGSHRLELVRVVVPPSIQPALPLPRLAPA